MIQQASLKLKCQVDNHKEEIDNICYHEFCTGFRLHCFDCCKQGIHHTHSDDVQKVHSLIPFIETNNKECDNLIDDLNKFLETLNQSFSQLTKGIRNKYSLVKERLVNMNSYQINDYLNSTIKLTEYKQSITKIIQDQINKLNHSFNNLYEQLQLSSFNNYQINDDDVKKLKLYAIKTVIQGKIQKALEQLDKSILINPNNKESLSYKVQCLRLLNKPEDAIICLEKALAIDRNHKFFLSEKALCLRMLNKYEEAITWSDKALAIDPENVFSLNEKAQCLRLLNKYEEAITWSDKALAIDPENVFPQVKRVDFIILILIAQCLRLLNKYEEAITWSDKALAIDPENVFPQMKKVNVQDY